MRGADGNLTFGQKELGRVWKESLLWEVIVIIIWKKVLY